MTCLPYTFISLCFMYYLLLAFTFHSIFIFAHLSIYFLVIFILLTWSFLFFSFIFLRYLIININLKKLLMVLGLFGYYPWHDGAVDFFLGLRIRNLGISRRLWYGERTDLGFAIVFANVSVEQESPPTFYFILRKG